MIKMQKLIKEEELQKKRECKHEIKLIHKNTFLFFHNWLDLKEVEEEKIRKSRREEEKKKRRRSRKEAEEENKIIRDLPLKTWFLYL